MTVAIDQPPPPRVKRWTKQEYNDLVERGAFRGQHVYLFRGELIEMSPQYHPHAFAITELDDELRLVLGTRKGFKVRIQLPFETPGESMPEPDVLVCTDVQYQRRPHPNEAVLVVEVADSSLSVDREKAFDYAAAQVPEYWIVDVNKRQLEVYRNPVPDSTAPFGYRYAMPTFVTESGSVELLAKPGAPIRVAQLFH